MWRDTASDKHFGLNWLTSSLRAPPATSNCFYLMEGLYCIKQSQLSSFDKSRKPRPCAKMNVSDLFSLPRSLPRACESRWSAYIYSWYKTTFRLHARAFDGPNRHQRVEHPQLQGLCVCPLYERRSIIPDGGPDFVKAFHGRIGSLARTSDSKQHANHFRILS